MIRALLSLHWCATRLVSLALTSYVFSGPLPTTLHATRFHSSSSPYPNLVLMSHLLPKSPSKDYAAPFTRSHATEYLQQSSKASRSGFTVEHLLSGLSPNTTGPRTTDSIPCCADRKPLPLHRGLLRRLLRLPLLPRYSSSRPRRPSLFRPTLERFAHSFPAPLQLQPSPDAIPPPPHFLVSPKEQ